MPWIGGNVSKGAGAMSLPASAKIKTAESEFRLVFLVALAIFFVAIAAGRLLPRRWRWNVSGHDEGKSVWGAAKTAACNTIPFAFM
jgi:hypothetical protein